MTKTISSHHFGSEEPASVLSAVEVRKSVSCVICQAVYAPTQTALVQASDVVIESAFMSMCHFCFRCRRPACPSCWDDVHGVCGVCALEANLPFRVQAVPLRGMLFPPPRRSPEVRVRPLAAPLVCVRPGQFQRAPLPIDMVTTVQTHAISPQPAHTQTKRPTPYRQNPLPAQQITRSPVLQSAQAASPQPRPSTSLSSEEVAKRAAIAEVNTRPARREPRSISLLERLLTGLLMGLLLTIFLLIVAAELSATVNSLLLSLLHIDIRAEIAYLWLLIRQLHI